VTSAYGWIQDYTVTVTVAALSSAKAITGIYFPTSTATTIDEVAHTITVTGCPLHRFDDLVRPITHTGASINPASGVAQDFYYSDNLYCNCGRCYDTRLYSDGSRKQNHVFFKQLGRDRWPAPNWINQDNG